MRIQTMATGDYPAVHSLWLNTPGMGLNTEDDSEEGFCRYLRRNPNTCFVAREGKLLVGCILAGHDGRRGFLYHTAVLPAHRGKGIGRALVEKAMAALEQEGIYKVALVVFDRNTGGNAFWEACGFSLREDLCYRNRAIHPLTRIDT